MHPQITLSFQKIAIRLDRNFPRLSGDTGTRFYYFPVFVDYRKRRRFAVRSGDG